MASALSAVSAPRPGWLPALLGVGPPAMLFLAMLLSIARPGIAEAAALAKWPALVGLVGAGILLRRRLDTSSTLARAGIGVFLLVASASSLLGPADWRNATERVGSFWLLFAAAFLAPLPAGAYERLKAWMVIAAVCCQAVVLLSLVDAGNPDSYGNVRFRGVLNNANSLGTAAAITVVSGFARVMLGQGPWRWVALGSVLTGGLCLALSQSLSSTGATLMGCLAVLAATGRSLRPGRGLVVLGVAVAAAAHFASQDLANRQARFREINTLSRDAVWERHLQEWRLSPLWGHGFELAIEGTGAVRTGGESSYSDTFVVAGILGGLPLLVGLGAGVADGLRVVRAAGRRAPREVQLGLASAFGALIALLVNSFGEGYLMGVGNAYVVLVWVLCGGFASLAARARALRGKG